VYCVSINNPVLIISNTVSVIVTGITLAFAARYRAKSTNTARNQ
jgi:heme/copper-type cytochrome/quinol oxidase subunit 2